jgi:undecaprenyl diphosphate synthase
MQQSEPIPQHIAIIMDGNRRWAKKNNVSSLSGHKAGVQAIYKLLEAVCPLGVKHITLFAFSSENWQRDKKDVAHLMQLLTSSITREGKKLLKNDIRLKIIGDASCFSSKVQKQIAQLEEQSLDNSGLYLTLAVNYGGRWDITAAVKKIISDLHSGVINQDAIDEKLLGQYTCLAHLPEPDLFIRTSGEQRISNFLLWQLAYTELYFTDTLWPDFDQDSLQQAITSFQARNRRFGK